MLIIPKHTSLESNTEKILRIAVTVTLNNASFIWLYLIHVIKEFINITLQVAVPVKDNSTQCLHNSSPENKRILQSNIGGNTVRSAAPHTGRSRLAPCYGILQEPFSEGFSSNQKVSDPQIIPGLAPLTSSLITCL